ncbi:MAG: ABC transporter permease [Anaerococcus sp.]|nr:ABC transporter permease [Anaerococcus sp.]
MNRFFTVAIDSWKRQMKSPAFWLMVFFPLIFILITSLITYFASKNEPNSQTRIVADQEVIDLMENPKEFDFESLEASKKDFENKDIESFLEIKENEGIITIDYHIREMNPQSITKFNFLAKEIQTRLNIKNAGLTKENETILQRQPSFNIIEDEEGGNPIIMYVLFFALIFYMYFVLIMYSNNLIMEIAIEKGSKMIEFIFSSIRPGQYFAGKIFGNFLVILTHSLIYLISALIAFINLRSSKLLEDYGIDLSTLLASIDLVKLGQIFILILASIFIYMETAAMLGSLVKKQEDAGKVASPLMLVIIFAFFIAMFYAQREEGTLVQVLSYLPFISVFFMPLRLIRSTATPIEGLISIAILILAIVLLYKFASRIYKKNILNYSSGSIFNKLKRGRKK